MALRSLLPALLRKAAPRRAPASVSSVAAAARCEPPAEPREGPGSQPSSGTPRRAPVPPVDFGNTEAAYRSRTNGELLRSWLVLRMCAVDQLVEKHEELLGLSQKLLGQRLFNRLMKMTFYGQFVGGEDQEAIKPLIKHNQAFGVGSILDYSVEEDLSQEEAEKKEMDSCTADAEKNGRGACRREKQFQAHRAFGDRRDGVISARTYFYANEAKCDQHMETFLRCIDASGEGPGGDGAGRQRPGLAWNGLPPGRVRGGRAAGVRTLGGPWLVPGAPGASVSQEFLAASPLRLGGALPLFLPKCPRKDPEPGLGPPDQGWAAPGGGEGRAGPAWTGGGSRGWGAGPVRRKGPQPRCPLPPQRATKVGVRLMVDAERVLQAGAISRLTLEMQRKFNTREPVIFNTYQCYLKDAYDNVSLDVELARREGWCFGAKLVRGAYMAQERERAAEVGYEGPFGSTPRGPTPNYPRCLNYILEEIKHQGRASLMVASHNEDTVRFTIQK
ncbi:proline dehydrogenase 1, mitochondrial [Sarcophilus harrisii]|uniref:proline dehydrogenase 1, mitochondrial n=1 Tax=Sarcophilus harrisii TaxID=9305 RepID=UPI001301BACA|nr:proline dehydrogenase 1, mitochondrial [Sarcophilus harrisii]